MVLLFFVPLTTGAYTAFNSNLAEAYTSIFNLNFQRADSLLERERMERPGNDLVQLYYGYSDFLKAFISEDKDDFELLKKNNEKRLMRLQERKDEASPFYLYSRAELMMQEAMVRVKFREYVSAVNLFIKAERLVMKNSSVFPTFLLNEKLSAIINIVAGSVPEQYQWLSDMAGIEGTVSEGKRRLRTLYAAVGSHEYKCYRPELLFYLTMAESIYAADEKEFDQWLKEYRSFPNSVLLAYSHSNMLMKYAKNDEAIEVISGAVNLQPDIFPFLYYKRGLAFLRKGELNRASQDFKFFLSRFKGVNYIKSAWQKLSWIALLQGDNEGYFRCRTKVVELGAAHADEDKEALFEAKHKHAINSSLLSARLFFDGGYYTESLKSLLATSADKLSDEEDRLEYTYRMGRIMEKTGREDRAISCYKTVVETGSNHPYHFAANSALLLGAMYERNKDDKNASKYYQLALSMKNHQYKNSIDQKARAGLQRVEK